MNGDNLQRAIYSKLTGDETLMALITGVYADVQQPADAGSDGVFPYVTIGNDTLNSWDSKTFVGTQAICQIDVWSRANNMTEAKAICSAITDVLHYQALAITDASHVHTIQQSASFTRDPDGHTKRGLLLFEVTFVRS